MNDIKQRGRPGDGNLAEHDRRAALTNHKEAGEMTRVNPSPARGEVTDWRALAACRDVDPELFFPTAPAGAALAAAERRALAVCAGCPVLADCRTWAVAEQPHGIAGGLTERARAALRWTRSPVTTASAGQSVRRSEASAREQRAGRAV